ncbi:MFS transporter [Actinomadura rubrobrunea]|uniref:MFS transporter n=2 Tax=Actinomadura rubrobrunea TaxID=115335 RepID=A0A9W6PXN8_9ACTN|nr:MFS transporter [Actinomadura rubrobrunea]GLW66314.1 MFS transporter [Actinomadura rubrobrunea]
MTSSASAASTPALAGRRADGPASALVVPAAATLLALMNYCALLGTLVDTAAGLRAGPTAQIWMMSSISLGLSAVLLTAGGLADDHGRRRVFVGGAVLLTLASVACALAPNAAVFVAGRIAQGAASAALIAGGLGIVGHAFSGAARARATGVWGAMLGLGIALGPVTAAALTGVTWRLWYWTCAAAAILLAVAAARSLPESRADRPRGLDLPGVVTMSGGVTALLTAVTVGRTGWTRPAVPVLLVAAAILLGAFAAVESRRRHPMLDPALLRRRLFLVSTGAALVTGLAVIGVMSYLGTLLDLAYGFTPLTAALLLTVWSVPSFASALQARRLTARVAPRPLLAAGLLLSAVGEAAMLGLTPGGNWWRLVPGLVVAGVGSGLANAVLARLAVESVPADRAAMGSGANNTARYVGASLGVAMVVAIATGGDDRSPASLTHGANIALVVSAVLAAAGAVLVVAVRDRQPRDAATPAVR